MSEQRRDLRERVYEREEKKDTHLYTPSCDVEKRNANVGDIRTEDDGQQKR